MTRGRDQRTSPDAKAAREALMSTSVPFTQEYKLGPYWFDFAVPGLRLLIEVDGRTYHRHPSRQARDRAKQALAESGGWKLVRVSRPDVAGKVRAAYDRREGEIYDPDLTTADPDCESGTSMKRGLAPGAAAGSVAGSVC